MRHVVLIGLSGSGKSTLGRLLASETGMSFVDLDEAVELKLGMPVRRIFERYGESFFRDAEATAAREAASDHRPTVIASGGGVVLRPENARALRENGFVVFLDRPVELIAEDMKYGDDRPLLSGAEKLYEMERGRRRLYLDAAHAVLKNRAGLEEALRELLDMTRRTLGRSLYGCAVIGDPIAHTLSPAIHGIVFEALGVEERYGALRVPREELASFAERARESGMRGFNVTIPHKSAIIPLLDEVVGEAGLCGAVNTVLVRGGRLSGFNTDMGGLLESLRAIGHGYRGKNILILGAGGASRGVALKAAMEGAGSVAVLARGPEKAEEIRALVRRASTCRVRAGEMTADAMSAAAREADILINATPLGMSGIGADFDSLEFLDSLPEKALVCDLVYSPPETKLLRRAAELGLPTQNGLGMLIYQALLADELFLERKLDKPALYKIVRERLTK
jgi:shikimate dehydrogenase